MWIFVFEVDIKNYNRCQQFYFTFLYIIIGLLVENWCGFVNAVESIVTDTEISRISTVISPSSIKQEKHSSVIYISSLNDVNTVGTLHSSEHDIRFEDFFWNGSGDEPLTLSLKSNARLTVNGLAGGRETFIKTATVIATVYIDDSTENECESSECDPNNIPDPNVSPSKRFWLVTTLLGHLNDDIPLLQERLADVYRIAFTKQQSLHLGLTNATNESSNEHSPIDSLANDTTPIIENKQSTNLSMPINPTSVLKYEYAVTNATVFTVQSNLSSTADATMPLQSDLLFVETSTTNSVFNVKSTINSNQSDPHRSKRSVSSILPSSIITSATTATIQSAQTVSTIAKLPVNTSDINNTKLVAPQKVFNIRQKTIDKSSKNRNDAIIGRISVLIHNISVMSNSEKDYADHQEWTSEILSNSSSSDTIFMKSDNQTEIIYTVFVNGMPVLATIAASDMKLMSEAEVSKILDAPIFTKAEPYLKEPQATPLIPSSTTATNQNKPILAMIFQNPYILLFISALVLLIILLLMLLMLITGSKNQRKPPKNCISKSAQTAQQSFLPPVPPSASNTGSLNTASAHITSIDENHQFRSNMTNDMLNRQPNATTTMATVNRQKKQVGTQITSLHDSVDGFGCERDHSFIIIPTPLKRKQHKKIGTPTIYFPEPPPSSEPSSPSHSQTQSTASTSSTTDSSSIYYIKKHKNSRHQLYSKRPKRFTALNHREYATITKKQIERAQKKSKQKRKYLKGGSNRIAAAFEETAQVHSSHSTVAGHNSDDGKRHSYDIGVAVSDGTFEMSTGKDSNLYEHIEAFNPMVGKKKPFATTKKCDSNGNTMANETEQYAQGKSCLIDKRQNNKDPVNQMKNGMNACAVENSANGSRHKKTKDRNTKPSTHSSKNTSDESQQVKMNRFSNQLSNNDVHDTMKDDLSIGSFLSMASTRTFPKCDVPEPLSRVLEPVSVTHLNQYDEIEATEAAAMAAKLPRIVDAKAKTFHKPQQYQPSREHFTQQKNDETVYLSRTRSDGADPGVIGPIAWQYHKKRLEDSEHTKHHNDLLCTQHRYEDLLEGAISLYSIETTEYHTIETITKEEYPEIVIGKDMRGKSADMFPNSASIPKSSPNTNRPFTAMPTKTAPEDPPITSKDAWTGSSLIRTSSAELRQTTQANVSNKLD